MRISRNSEAAQPETGCLSHPTCRGSAWGDSGEHPLFSTSLVLLLVFGGHGVGPKGLSSLVIASDWQVEDGLQSSLFWSTKASRDSQPVQGHITSKGWSWNLPAKCAPSPARNDKGSIKGEIPQGQVSAALDCDNPKLNLPLTWASGSLRDQTSAAGGRPAHAASTAPFYRWQREAIRGPWGS